MIIKVLFNKQDGLHTIGEDCDIWIKRKAF